MPSLAFTAGATALALAVASNAATHVDTRPIHLRAARSNLRRRQDADTTSTSTSSANLFAAASLPPPKQDCTYASTSFESAQASQGYRQLLQANIEAADAAIKSHKNEPSSTSSSVEKRAKGSQKGGQPAPKWRWDFGGSNKVRGVNLGGWLVTEVRVFFPSSSPDKDSRLVLTVHSRQPWITPSLFSATNNDCESSSRCPPTTPLRHR